MNSQTRLCGIIGNPVEHSLSPVMHNAAFQKLGLNYAYMAFNTSADQLAQAMQGIRGLNLCGANITTPYKIIVVPLLDEVSEAAQQIGAVNTIVNDAGRLTGHNTDGAGFIEALSQHDISPSGIKVVLLGTGGAARAIAFALVKQGTRLVIFNRREHLDRAEDLANNLNQYAAHKVIARELNTINLENELEDAGMLVNATRAGMSPDIDTTPVPVALLKPGLVVFDIVYHPLETRLLKEANQVGCLTLNGIDMLVAQGALGFELWTGVKAPMDTMRQAVLQALGKPDIKIERHMKTSIALIGFMGSGKSMVSRVLAKKLGKKLIVMDELIVKRVGKPISRIFAEDTEPAFRKLETEITREVAASQNQVIDCGGGIVLEKANMDMLKAQAMVVYLAAMPEIILKRVNRDRTRRPLLANTDKAGTIKSLLEYRRPLYEQAADIAVDTGGKNVDEIAREIILKLRQYEYFTF